MTTIEGENDMAKAWKKFESDTTNYLQDNFGSYATFIQKGASDSTTPDIEVTTAITSFYIEAKKCSAQCSQFVLFPNDSTKRFEYSGRNFTPLNNHSLQIIAHMNQNFDTFKKAGTKGVDIIFDNAEQTFVNWILDYYKSKNVKYFITNNFKILPIANFGQHFAVTAQYRIKKSGSSAVGKTNANVIVRHIYDLGYNIDAHRLAGSKVFVSSQMPLDKQKFKYDQYTYMFAERGTQYEIRKLSNTDNKNVIFSITNKNLPGLTKDDFISALILC